MENRSLARIQAPRKTAAVRRRANTADLFDEILAMDPGRTLSRGCGHVANHGNDAVQNNVINVRGDWHESAPAILPGPAPQQAPRPRGALYTAAVTGATFAVWVSTITVACVLAFFIAVVWIAVDRERHPTPADYGTSSVSAPLRGCRV